MRGRPFNPELSKSWKVVLPAPLAGAVELALWDNIHNKPRYGERGKVIEELLRLWLDGKIPQISIQPVESTTDIMNREDNPHA